jgi:glycosyltransferase involved in cell wall biosynthesis
MISVLILTFNEEENLPECLAAVRWSDDIVVLDSGSSDRTIEIAKAAGARIFYRCFDNERNHRAASLRLPFRHRWVYCPDADEVTTPELRDEMLQAVQDETRPEVAYRVRFRTMFQGRWIRRSSLYPTWVVRLLQPRHVSFDRMVNLRYRIHGPEGKLQHHFEHYTFRRGLAAWIDKHNRYSTAEAMECLWSLATARVHLDELFSRSPVVRRRTLKELSFRLPFRPTLRFLYMYLVRGGILEGRAGLDYCRLLAMYERMILLKMDEIRRDGISAPYSRSVPLRPVLPHLGRELDAPASPAQATETSPSSAPPTGLVAARKAA